MHVQAREVCLLLLVSELNSGKMSPPSQFRIDEKNEINQVSDLILIQCYNAICIRADLFVLFPMAHGVTWGLQMI